MSKCDLFDESTFLNQCKTNVYLLQKWIASENGDGNRLILCVWLFPREREKLEGAMFVYRVIMVKSLFGSFLFL